MLGLRTFSGNPDTRSTKSKIRNNPKNRNAKFKRGRGWGWEIWSFGFRVCFACLLEAPPCGAKAGISIFEFGIHLVFIYYLNFSLSSASIFSNRLLCLPPEKGVSNHVLTISFARSFPTIRPPMTRILASVCSRQYRAE